MQHLPLMNRAQPWQSYRHISTHTASSGQLVEMLYEGAIRFLEHALAGFAHEDPLEFNRTVNNNVIRAQSIIGELNRSLDMDQGGEIAMVLRRLYDYMDKRLTESNLQKAPDGIHDTLRRLTVLRDAWRQMLTHSMGAARRSEDCIALMSPTPPPVGTLTPDAI